MVKPKQKIKTSHALIPIAQLSFSKYEAYFLPIVLAITFFCFSTSLQNKFVNLDDPQYLITNPIVQSINSANLKAIFSQQFVGNYQPVTMLVYLLAYRLFGLHPVGYHLLSLLLHLLSTLLVFFIIKKISGNKIIAFITSLLFGIHPMHVESVAWVAELKDVLYGFFFLWAIYLYVKAIPAQSNNTTLKLPLLMLVKILIVFLLALLSKAQAVVLPIIFIALDFILNRRITKENMLEKIPFFVLAIIFGLFAIKFQGNAGAIQSYQYFPFYERVLFSCYALMMYLYKLILPINLSCFYPYPETMDQINTGWVYASPVILFALTFIVLKFFRKSKVILFGVAFFLITIILVLQLVPIGDALYADRYTYIPSIGIFFIAAHYLTPYLKNKTIRMLTSAIIVWFCYLTFQRTQVWYDSIRLYTNAMDNGYKAAILYNNRGAVLSDSGKNAEALKDFDALVKLKPRYPNGWRNKGLIHLRLNQKEEATMAFSEAINFFPNNADNYLSRGNLFVEKNDFENALKNFTKVIELKPESAEGYYARSEAYGKSNRLPEALADINTCIRIEPNNGQAYNNRGIIYSMIGKFPEAINDFTIALKLKQDNAGVYTNRALAYKSMGKYKEALKDLLTAKEMGVAVDENSITELRNMYRLKK